MNVKKALRAAIKEHGYKAVKDALISADVSPRAAERLCKDDYDHEPKALKPTILRALSDLAVTAAKSA